MNGFLNNHSSSDYKYPRSRNYIYFFNHTKTKPICKAVTVNIHITIKVQFSLFTVPDFHVLRNILRKMPGGKAGYRVTTKNKLCKN